MLNGCQANGLHPVSPVHLHRIQVIACSRLFMKVTDGGYRKGTSRLLTEPVAKPLLSPGNNIVCIKRSR